MNTRIITDRAEAIEFLREHFDYAGQCKAGKMTLDAAREGLKHDRENAQKLFDKAADKKQLDCPIGELKDIDRTDGKEKTVRYEKAFTCVSDLTQTQTKLINEAEVEIEKLHNKRERRTKIVWLVLTAIITALLSIAGNEIVSAVKIRLRQANKLQVEEQTILETSSVVRPTEELPEAEEVK